MSDQEDKESEEDSTQTLGENRYISLITTEVDGEDVDASEVEEAEAEEEYEREE